MADRTVTLTADEMQAVIEEVSHVHSVEDFEAECPVCTAYVKLKAAAAGSAALPPPPQPDDEEIEALAMQCCGDLRGDRLCMTRDQRINFARRVLAAAVPHRESDSIPQGGGNLTGWVLPPANQGNRK